MENRMQIFQNEEFGELRTVRKNGDPWFVGKDVAKALGYSNPRKALLTMLIRRTVTAEMG